MKKLFLLLVSGAFLTAANAQIQFGVKAGANFATLTGSDIQDAKMKVGIHGGAFVALPVGSMFSVQPEVLYSGQGAKADADGTTVSLNLNYINVPVLFKYNNPCGFFAETGPQLGFLMSAKYKAGSNSQDAKSAYKSTDFAWAIGAGYLIKSVNVGIDARYNLGLSSIAKDVDGQKVDAKSGVFQFGVFYLFGGKGK